jgi:hypothetical protein
VARAQLPLSAGWLAHANHETLESGSFACRTPYRTRLRPRLDISVPNPQTILYGRRIGL